MEKPTTGCSRMPSAAPNWRLSRPQGPGPPNFAAFPEAEPVESPPLQLASKSAMATSFFMAGRAAPRRRPPSRRAARAGRPCCRPRCGRRDRRGSPGRRVSPCACRSPDPR
ncbi:MAG: hypothetical protein E6J78_20035 [Deltaproteobacteria bacterium]|nr:MAG: hypothetical protein E6J78_20035 [Deltaproteobacteria bacterium]